MSPASGTVFAAVGGETLAAALRKHLPDRSWNDVRRFVTSGKVSVRGQRVLDPARRLGAGDEIAFAINAPAPTRPAPTGFKILHEDAHLIVIEKPEGVPTLPWDARDSGTALDLIRDAWRREKRQATATPLFVVHRLDKETSGVLVFAKTKPAERGLHHVFKNHLAERQYTALVHGTPAAGRIESWFIPDRGDGIRGSSRTPGRGQHAVTHVEIAETLGPAALVRVRIETGRTHQIRIHLAESGHPVVGETVYIRDLRRRGGRELPSRRLMLHAQKLAFVHPITQERLVFDVEPPASFVRGLRALREPPPRR